MTLSSICVGFALFGFASGANREGACTISFKSSLHSLFTATRYPSTQRLRVSPTYTVSLSVITAHRDRNLAFSLKELRAWNFLQSRGAAFPQYGKGVDNVNDTASVGNSGRTQPRNIDVSRWRRRRRISRRTNRNNTDESRGRAFYHDLRPVRFCQDLSDPRSLWR